MNRYENQPQSLLWVFYDACVFFKQIFRRFWPILLVLWLLALSQQVINSYFGSSSIQQLIMIKKISSDLLKESLSVHQWGWYIPYICMLLSGFIQFYLLIYLTLFIHDTLVKGQASYRHIWRRLCAVWWLVLLQTLVVYLFVYLGLSLLFLPGIVVYILLYQAKFLLLLDQVSWWRALRDSAQLVWGTGWWRTFILALFVLVFYSGSLLAYAWILKTIGSHNRLYAYSLLALLSLVNIMGAGWFVCCKLSLFHDLKLRWLMPKPQ